jgi:hypothetical protein
VFSGETSWPRVLRTLRPAESRGLSWEEILPSQRERQTRFLRKLSLVRGRRWLLWQPEHSESDSRIRAFGLRHHPQLHRNSVYRTTSRYYALRDWQASGSILAYSGQPFTPKVSGTQDLGQATRPNRLCNGTLSNRTITQWFDPACFAIPASGFGNSGRNILNGPDSVTVNLALGRILSMGEYGHLEFRWETFGTPDQLSKLDDRHRSNRRRH